MGLGIKGLQKYDKKIRVSKSSVKGKKVNKKNTQSVSQLGVQSPVQCAHIVTHHDDTTLHHSLTQFPHTHTYTQTLQTRARITHYLNRASPTM